MKRFRRPPHPGVRLRLLARLRLLLVVRIVVPAGLFVAAAWLDYSGMLREAEGEAGIAGRAAPDDTVAGLERYRRKLSREFATFCTGPEVTRSSVWRYGQDKEPRRTNPAGGRPGEGRLKPQA